MRLEVKAPAANRPGGQILRGQFTFPSPSRSLSFIVDMAFRASSDEPRSRATRICGRPSPSKENCDMKPVKLSELIEALEFDSDERLTRG